MTAPLPPHGLTVDQTSDANFVPVDTADNWLHFGLGVGMVALGVLPPRRTASGGQLSDHQPGIIE